MLTGKLTRDSISDPADLRKYLPRSGKDHFNANMNLVSQLNPLAQARDISLATLSLAWVLAKGEDIIPNPGTRQIPYLMENIQAASICLDTLEMENN